MNSFGSWTHDSNYPFNCPTTEGDYSLSPATPSYWPQSTTTVDDVIDELDVLLTSGRLSGTSNRALIKSLVEPIFASDVAKAVRAALQLIVSTPQFHATSTPRNSNNARSISGYTTKHKAPYKAVVIVMLRGGADSWNMLVPKGGCATADAYAEYVEARGAHSIPAQNLTSIDATGSGQDCTEYGLHKSLGVIGELYNAGEAIFFANTGK